MKYKPYIIFSTLIAFALFLIFAISTGIYPILSVNGELIFAKTFWKNYQAGSTYYQYVKQNLVDSSDINEITADDIKRSVLTQLVENKLIEEGARKEVGKEFDSLIKEKIATLNKDPNIDKATKIFYNLSFADFEKEILTPIANQEILVGRLFLKGQKIESWLEESKKSSQIKVFSGEFFWDGQEIKLKK